MIEELADHAHDMWCGWMQYLFFNSVRNADGTMTIPVEMVTRWERQMVTEYGDLPKVETQSDRQAAEKILAVLHKAGNWTQVKSDQFKKQEAL